MMHFVMPWALLLLAPVIFICCWLQGIEAHPLREDSMFEWAAKITGLRGSLWEGLLAYNMLYAHTKLIIAIIRIVTRTTVCNGWKSDRGIIPSQSVVFDEAKHQA